MSNILSSITQLNVGGVALDLINSEPLGKTAALRAVAMNYTKCALVPVVFPNPLDLNMWNATFTINEPPASNDYNGNPVPQDIILILPNFNQTGLLVEVVSIILQPLPGIVLGIPPSVNIAPLINLDYWATSTSGALKSSSPFYDQYKFTPSEYDNITKLQNVPKVAIVTVAFKGSTAN